MNDMFFKELGISAPTVRLRAGGDHAGQTAKIETKAPTNWGSEPGCVIELATGAIKRRAERGSRLAIWDGHAASRMLAVLAQSLCAHANQ